MVVQSEEFWNQFEPEQSESTSNSDNFWGQFQDEKPKYTPVAGDKGWTISAYKPPSILDRLKQTLQWVVDTPRLAYTEGKQNVDLAVLETKEMFGGLNPEEKQRLNALNDYEAKNFDIQEPQYANKNITNLGARVSNFFKKGYVEAFRMLPMTVETLKSGGFGYAAGSLIGAGGAVVAGQLGPQAATPEEVVTVPAMAVAGAKIGGGWGGRIGAAKKVFELEAGFARSELKQIVDEEGKPLDPVALNGLSVGVGGINAVLELTGLSLMLKTVPGGDKILSKISKEGVKDLASNPTVRQALMDVAVKYSKGVAGETSTEMAQEFTNIVAGEIARKMQGVNSTPMEKNVARILETGVSTMGAMLYTGGVGSTAQTVNILIKDGKNKAEAKQIAEKMTLDEKAEFVQENFEKLVPDSQNVNFAEEEKTLRGGVTYNRIKTELERQGASEEYADKSAILIQQAHNVIADKFGEEGKEHLEKSNIQVLMNSNNQDQAIREKQFVDTELKNRNLQEFSPSELQTDAKTFQYKENSDDQGVTERLQGVDEFDPLFAGEVIVYENKEGEKFIVDGHQRLGLAKRLGDDNIKLKGYLFKESEGYTPEQVRVLAAQKNIAEGSGTAIDTAKIIKEIGFNKLPKSLPTNSAMVKDGIALARLGDNAFQKVVNGDVTPAQGARIADAIRTDELKQELAIDAVRTAKPENLEQVYMLAREVAMADTTQSEQVNLFGTQQLFESTALEKIQIVDKAIKSLKADKKIFNGLIRNSSKIQSKGKNRLDKSTNEEIRQQAAVAIELIEKLATMKGKISDKAIELALKLKSEEINMNEAVMQFREFVTSKEVIDDIYGRSKKEVAYNQDIIQKALEGLEEDSKVAVNKEKAEQHKKSTRQKYNEEYGGAFQAALFNVESSKNGQTTLFDPLEFYQKGFYQAPNTEITKSAAFKEWFGDSKVVDEDGKPLVVYHGTRSVFDIFDKDQKGKASTGAKVGFWFTETETFAKSFAEDIWYGDEKKSIVMPVYLSMKNPKIYEPKIIEKEAKQKINEKIKSIKNDIKELTEQRNEEFAKTYSWAGMKIFNDKIEKMDKKLKKAENDYAELRYNDSYEQFKTDIYKIENRGAEDANFGGIGMVLKNNDTVEKFVEQLKKQGYDGIIIKDTSYDTASAGTETNTQYAAFESSQIKSVNNKGSFDVNSPNIYNQGKRGQFRIDEDGTAIIDILENGDASTLVHELGHFYLYSLETLATQNNRAAKELSEINKWLGKADNQEYTQEEMTEFHEKFARGFEAYLLNGEAPTIKMKSAFENFKDWLRKVYDSVRDLDVEFSEDTKMLFDRVFTTDEEYEKEVLPKYTYNYETILQIEKARKNPAYQLREKMYNTGKFLSDWYDKLVIPIETRLGKFSPELREKLRNHTADLALITGKDYEAATDLFKATQKMKKESRKDYETFDLALKNRDDITVKLLANKYGFSAEFEAVRDILDDIYSQALEVGIDVGYLEHYFPRLIKYDMTDKFLEYIDMLALKEEIDIKNQVLKLEDAKISRILKDITSADNSQFWSPEDRAKFINNKIRGFGKNNILLGRNANLKYGRMIDELDGNFNQFYESFETALIGYMGGSRRVIEARKFFGSENAEVGKLRATIKRKRKTLAEVKDRTPSQAKWKEFNRLKYELSPIKIKIESFEKQEKRTLEQEEILIQLKNKKYRLQRQINWVEEANPFQVKGVVVKRLAAEIQEASKKIADILGDENNVEDSIGALITSLSVNKDIHAKDEKVIRELLLARFNASKIADPVRIARDMTYIATLNDITNAITQFGDLAFSVYKYGFSTTAKGIGKPFEIKKEDLGLNDMAYEFSNTSRLSKWLKKQFELIGLSAIDGFGKNTIIQSALLNAQKMAKKNNAQLDEKLKSIFGDKAEEVKKGLISGEVTDDTIIFAYHELSDIQPISEDQMPELYQNGGGFMRLFYTLKTFGIKALDIARNDITDKIHQGVKTKNKKLVKEGLQNLIRLQMLLWLFGVPIDALRDILANRDINLFESFVDTLIPAFLVNRYLFRTADKEGVGSAITGFFTPAIVNVIENTGKSYSVTNIPFIGKPLYNWGIKEKK